MAMRKAGYCPKQRNTGHRERKRLLLYAAEGGKKNKTEYHYLKYLERGGDVVVRAVHGNDTDPVKLVKQLVKEAKETGYSQEIGDMAYCLVDTDFEEHKEKQIKDADNRAKKIAAEVIVSNPCFEVWYLCHFVFTTRCFNSNDEVIAALRKYLPAYEKSSSSCIPTLHMQKCQAIQNAKDLENYHRKNGHDPHTFAARPSTEVYKIPEALDREVRA